MNEIDKIKEEVEQRLQQQQSNKEFKDVGRVAQTKKERSAYKIISSTLLREIELDPVMAFNMIKKDTVWLPIDVQAERDKGNTSGSVYLKVKIRESLPTKPKDDKLFRSIYVLFLEKLQSDLSNCFNVEEIISLSDKYGKLEIDEIVGEFMFPEFKTGSYEQQAEIKNSLSKNPVFRIGFSSGGRFLRRLIKEVFGAKFENMFFVASDSARQTRNDALEKQPISKEESDLLIEKLTERHNDFLKANKEKIDKYKSMTENDLIKEMDNFSISTFSKQIYKKDIEIFRNELIQARERSVLKQTEVFKQNIKKSKERPNNWDWFDVVKEKSTDVVAKPKNKIINTKTPLSYIKRTGGFKIGAVTPSEIIKQFGFSSVNYGNYVDDLWSKDHTAHFLGAISDLGEILNFDIKKINELGALSIAFGAKGTRGALATYFPQTKDINLTKTNGDGSVAHEWGHYFDNVIVEKDLKRATNSFASEGLMPNEEIKGLYKELMSFFYKGKEGITPKLKFRFYPSKSDSVPSFSRKVNYSWENVKVELKSTIEETISQYDYLMTSDDSVYTTQIRVLGYIIKSFGLDYYDVDIQLKTSYFYHKSAYNFFEYCYKKSEREIVKAGSSRTKYWTSAVELFARAWETVVLKKLIDKGRVSNYLVADIPMEDVISADYFEPYPTGKEVNYIESILDRIIESVKKYYSIGDFKPTSDVREDIFIELSKDSKEGKDKRGVKVEKEKAETTVVFVEENKVVEEVKVEENNEIKIGLEFYEYYEPIKQRVVAFNDKFIYSVPINEDNNYPYKHIINVNEFKDILSKQDEFEKEIKQSESIQNERIEKEKTKEKEDLEFRKAVSTFVKGNLEVGKAIKSLDKVHKINGKLLTLKNYIEDFASKISNPKDVHVRDIDGQPYFSVDKISYTPLINRTGEGYFNYLLNKESIKEEPEESVDKLKVVSPFFGKSQYQVVVENLNSYKDVIDDLYEIISNMPKTYETDNIRKNDKIAYLHYFTSSSDWYIIEKDTEKNQSQAFGLAILNGNIEDAELGYISIEELKKYAELDFYFDPKKISEIIEIEDEELEVEEPEAEEQEESIEDLIEGLKILLEFSEGEERKELEDTIEGLKLLL
jgi:hypothetical protein